MQELPVSHCYYMLWSSRAGPPTLSGRAHTSPVVDTAAARQDHRAGRGVSKVIAEDTEQREIGAMPNGPVIVSFATPERIAEVENQ
jgi:hypothetical protein